MMNSPVSSILGLRFAVLSLTLTAVAVQSAPVAPPTDIDSALLDGMQYRFVGPTRGGRASTAVGIPSDPLVYYFGAAAGGVWKTTDGGMTWNPIFDDQPIASVSAIGVADSDPNVIFVGTGETCMRTDGSHGNGVYKSLDAGKTWTHVGLTETRYIGDIVVHPKDPDKVYVAALGQAWGPDGNEERGVYRSSDGGETWEKVLYVDQLTGAVDLAMGPTNSDILFASMWRVYRVPWGLESGGSTSGLYRSTDGGATWEELTNGLPQGLMGKIGVAISRADPKRVYAVIEASEQERGMYRSDDGGDSWEHISDEHELVQRPWYYMHVTADPKDRDTVYVPSLYLMKSTDGGMSWAKVDQYHPDNHGIWIDPENPLRMINANDGGANVTVNGGKSWTRSDLNQLTSQMYHIATDNSFPYNIYGTMQDYRTIALPSFSDTGEITDRDVEVVGGCQGGFPAPHPTDENIVYHSCTDGWIMKFDRRTGLVQRIDPWPESNLGLGASAAKYRFHWTTPMATSLHDPEVLYVGANVLFKTTDRGQSWEAISPDLTRDEEDKQGPAGGPLTKESIGIEYYNLIYAIAESPKDPAVLWVGADDGFVHVTRDGGKNWKNVTPPDLPADSRISDVEASPHEVAAAYLAVDRHQMNDYRPHILKTTDFGQTWSRIVSGIPDDTYLRAIREDPKRRGLLYAGTETGVFVSLDDGESWKSLQLNMPVTPIHDLEVKDNDLVLGTHGRGIWVLDDLEPLRQWRGDTGTKAHLFQSDPAYRIRTDMPYFRMQPPAGKNPQNGAVLRYYLPSEADSELKLRILDAEGNVVRTFVAGEDEQLTNEPGLNTFAWNLRYAGPRKVEDAYNYGSFRGPTALPGEYTIELTVDGETQTIPLELKPDPRVDANNEDLAAQFALHMEVSRSISTLTDVTYRIRDIRGQLDELEQAVGVSPMEEVSIPQAIRELRQKINGVEDAVTQLKAETFADLFHYGLKLDGKLASLMDVVGDGRPGLFEGGPGKPTDQALEVHQLLSGEVELELSELNQVITNDVPALNALTREKNLPQIDAGQPITRANE